MLASCFGVGAVVLVLMYVVSRSPAIALAFAVMASYAPVALVKYRARRRRSELRDLWPEVVDNLASGVRAGLSLPEALTQVGCVGRRSCGGRSSVSARTTARPGGSTSAWTG